MNNAFLLSGEPGSGKTTIIKEVLRRAGSSAGGFYTEEIRLEGAREGFRIVSLDGEEAVLAHISIRGPHRVGKYGVDVDSLDKLAVAAVRAAVRTRDIVVIDEIGKMELFSVRFREAVTEALESGKKVLGTIMLASHPWADATKRRPGVEVVLVTRANRGSVVERVLEWLESGSL
jgi:nucleoside-triphosphatase